MHHSWRERVGSLNGLGGIPAKAHGSSCEFILKGEKENGKGENSVFPRVAMGDHNLRPDRGGGKENSISPFSLLWGKKRGEQANNAVSKRRIFSTTGYLEKRRKVKGKVKWGSVRSTRQRGGNLRGGLGGGEGGKKGETTKILGPPPGSALSNSTARHWQRRQRERGWYLFFTASKCKKKNRQDRAKK